MACIVGLEVRVGKAAVGGGGQGGRLLLRRTRELKRELWWDGTRAVAQRDKWGQATS